MISLEKYWKYWIPIEIDESKYFSKDGRGNDVLTEVAKQTMIQDIRERSNLIAKMENSKGNMFTYIDETKLSKESLDKVKCHKDYEAVKDDIDLLKLRLMSRNYIW